MKILEQYLCGKSPDASLCEDGVVITDAFAAVVDGSTSKVAGRHAGRLAMQTVVRALATLPASATLAETLTLLTRELASVSDARGRNDAAFRPTCSAVIFSRERREVWLVGDCQCRFGGQTHRVAKAVDEVLTEIRCRVLSRLLAQGRSREELLRRDLGREAIADFLRLQTNFQNVTDVFNPFRYVILDGTPVAPSAVTVLRVPADEKNLVLASDGYPELFDSLAPTERRLQELLRLDPLCISANPATKGVRPGNLSFDDRAFLRLEI
ncbi:MAG: protein phosphatase 2C domain-containing protein [Alloprevotella sp.]